ncbi:MAG: DNA lyase [Bacteroidetes bacterium]|nr:DNA lyase [Bacteroidota bacterium]
MDLQPGHIDELRQLHDQHGEAVRVRLAEFRGVPVDRHFYELCFCLMTPQSSALQCDAVAAELEHRGFREHGFDPTPLLRSWQEGYVRFHNTKARRLQELRGHFGEVRVLLASDMEDKPLRNQLAATVRGLGMKEASHFLRNIGRSKLCIVDRHIIRNLLRLGVLAEWPSSISVRRYLDIEQRFEDLANMTGIPADELDLLLWQRETGFLLK